MQYKSFYKLMTGGSKLHFVARLRRMCSTDKTNCSSSVKVMDVDVHISSAWGVKMGAVTKVNLCMVCLQITSFCVTMMLECY
jgi:hypothetical protein